VIAVIVPAHNEQRLLARCLRALTAAARNAEARGEAVEILVVLDSCTDESETIALAHGVHTLTVSARNVGFARRAGAEWMIGRGARWLACTDADSCVPADWLICQLAFAADAVCGTVHIHRWQARHSPALRARYAQHYRHAEGHRHIHGANLGMCVQAYLSAGGFPAVSVHEDVRMVAALEENGAHIVWTARNSVSTSSRQRARVSGGFGDFLTTLASSVPV
jgi:glycosyltransferase involved in cell wall biosynthesis